MSTLLFHIHSSLIMSYVYVTQPGHREKSSVTDAEGIYRQEEAARGEREQIQKQTGEKERQTERGFFISFFLSFMSSPSCVAFSNHDISACTPPNRNLSSPLPLGLHVALASSLLCVCFCLSNVNRMSMNSKLPGGPKATPTSLTTPDLHRVCQR